MVALLSCLLTKTTSFAQLLQTNPQVIQKKEKIDQLILQILVLKVAVVGIVIAVVVMIVVGSGGTSDNKRIGIL